MQESSLKIGDLVVVDFRKEQLTDAISGWRNKTHVPFAESCFRQVWYGDAKTFDTFPAEGAVRKGFSFYEGAKGYEFLMKLNLGLLSKKQGEINIKGQFYQGWEKAQKKLPLSQQKYYDRLVQWITADTRLVGGGILGTFKTLRKELSARDLSGVKGKDQMLILGNLLPDGSVSPRSDGIARVCASNTGRKVSEIAVTHPDKKAQAVLFNHFSLLQRDGKIAARLSRVDFEDLPLAADVYDRIFVDRLAEEDVGINRRLVAAWRNRERRDNVMVHMEAPRKVTAQWRRVFGDSYVGPEDIDADMGMRARHNEKIVAEAGKAIEVVAGLRVRGTQPSRRILAEFTPAWGGDS